MSLKHEARLLQALSPAEAAQLRGLLVRLHEGSASGAGKLAPTNQHAVKQASKQRA